MFNIKNMVVGLAKSAVRVVRKAALAVAVVGLTVLGAAHASAQYSIVSSDGSGNVSFTPSALVVPVITGVIACVAASAALVLIWIGVKWLYRVLKGAK